jgi:hypothetical protein
MNTSYVIKIQYVVLKVHSFEDGQFVFEFSTVSQSGTENISREQCAQSSTPIEQINFIILKLEGRHLKFFLLYHCT